MVYKISLALMYLKSDLRVENQGKRNTCPPHLVNFYQHKKYFFI